MGARRLHLPSSRLSGADPVELQDQIARFGSSVIGIPPALAYRGSDAALMIYDGVTRVNRVAKLLPGRTVRVEVMRTLAKPDVHLRFSFQFNGSGTVLLSPGHSVAPWRAPPAGRGGSCTIGRPAATPSGPLGTAA
jgi:hypothetical protein